ncbi:MAG: GNAT family N-acetyltransferase [Treponema sp.]|nr:GNAT family N-acetyltransferase [Treponema sp.]
MKKSNRRLFLNKDSSWIVIIVIMSAIYCYFAFIHQSTRDLSFDSVRNRLTTLFAIISALAFWLQFKKTERLNESNYVMNLNNQFINNKNMTKIEHELELYYNQFMNVKNNLGRDMKADDINGIRLGINLSRTSEDCQTLIDYLVYLESMAVMVENGVIRIQDVDDLFSYRFFLAVNNPVVQEHELLPFSEFYRGTYRLCKRWRKNHLKKHIPIPMEEFCLTYERLAQWEEMNETAPESRTRKEGVQPAEYKKPHLDCGFARSIDNKKEIALCLYETDPYIYPEAFGDERDSAVDAISRIIGMDESLFDYDNLYLGRYNGQVCSVVCLYTGKGSWDKDRIRKRIGKDVLSTEAQEEGFEHASEKYFGTYKSEIFPKNTVELVAVCVEEGFRNKGIAKTMLQSLLNEQVCQGKTVKLTVLEENTGAITLYESLGFQKSDKAQAGFGPAGREPMTIEMVRSST